MLAPKDRRLPEEREPEVCYYKFFKARTPTAEDGRCLLCNGIPDEGCEKYITRTHVEDFYRKYAFTNPDEPIKRLEEGV